MSHDNCALGIPVGDQRVVDTVVGIVATAVGINTIKWMVLRGNSADVEQTEDAEHRLLDLGRSEVYAMLPREFFVVTDEIVINRQYRTIQFLDASPLHLAVKKGNINIAMALLLLDPTLLDKNAFVADGQHHINPVGMAHLYNNHRLELYYSLCVWKKLIENGFFSKFPTARSRITTLGFHTKTVLTLMRFLGRREWKNAFTKFVKRDMYNAIISLDGAVQNSYNLESISKICTVSVPPALQHLFTSATITMHRMNLLHFALMTGKYEAAAALLVLHPGMATQKAMIAGTDILLSARLFVKWFSIRRSTESRLACFKILTIAEQDIGLLEPLGLATRNERVNAAGIHANALLQQWMLVPVNESIARQWFLPPYLMIERETVESESRT